MRFDFTRYALIAMSLAPLALAPACKKSGSGEAIAKMTEFKDKMCACKDKACIDQVSSDMAKWTSEKSGAVTGASEEDTKKMAAISADLSGCMNKVITEAAAAQGSAAGSGSDAAGATAGSGSADAAGSAAAAGAGSAAADEAMAHRAGMCPSTVQGATTKSQAKGKTVVVTVEAADKNAIAAIQKRTEVLLAEKTDGSMTGAHDQKGSHGGSRGICPVYVPEGAKATAKKSAKGVAITITGDKPDELAKEIEDRIPKATEWVKANFKEADKGNQGGVGGGKGDHGANHSGKGDSKGHERGKGGGDHSGKGGGGGGGSGAGTGGDAKKGGW